MMPKTIKAETLESAFVLLGEAHANGTRRKPVPVGSPKGVPYFSRVDVLAAVETVAALERIERSLRNLAVKGCNVGNDDADEKREERLYIKANAIAAPWGVRLLLGGDVRGSQVRLQCPKSDRHNTWGGLESGWAL